MRRAPKIDGTCGVLFFHFGGFGAIIKGSIPAGFQFAAKAADERKAMDMERINYCEIDLEAIRNNVRVMRAAIDRASGLRADGRGCFRIWSGLRSKT